MMEWRLVDNSYRWICRPAGSDANYLDHEVRGAGSAFYVYNCPIGHHPDKGIRIAGPFDTLEAAKAACVLLEAA